MRAPCDELNFTNYIQGTVTSNSIVLYINYPRNIAYDVNLKINAILTIVRNRELL